MSLENFLNDGKIRKQKTSVSEITDLFAVATRDLEDVKKVRDALSADWQFNVLYNSCLKLCTVLLRSQGYRSGPTSHHKNTIECLPCILGSDKKKYQRYLDSCRVKRNKVSYDKVGLVSESEVDDLFEFTENFYKEVSEWMYANHPELM